MRTILFKPVLIAGVEFASIAGDTQIRDLARIEDIERKNLGWESTLQMGNRVNIEQGVRIVCQGRVTIEDDVSITPYCVIVDTCNPHDP